MRRLATRSVGLAVSTTRNVRWASATPEQRLLKLEEQVSELEKRCESLEQCESTFRFYANIPRTPLVLEEVVRRCADRNYQPHVFCHRELPIMLAHLMKHLEALPCGLSAMPAIRFVRGILYSCLSRLAAAPLPTTTALEEEFIKVVQAIDEEIEPTLTLMAKGVLELRREVTKHRRAVYSRANKRMPREDFRAEYRSLIQKALDDYNSILIQFKFLSRQLCSLNPNDTRYIGLIDTELDIVETTSNAIHEAKEVCLEHFGDSPEVNIVIPEGQRPSPFPHWGESISYAVKELMKNALRATVERHMKRNESGIVDCDDMPPITVTIAGGDISDHCCVCICDEGGGIPRHDMEKVLSYTFTTTQNPLLLGDDADTDRSESREEETAGALAGYGYGLPMSCMYARCFGGNLQLQSMEGFGTKAFLHIRRTSVLDLR